MALIHRTTFKVLGSNDDTTWNELGNITINGDSTNPNYLYFTDTTPYTSYRFVITAVSSGSIVQTYGYNFRLYEWQPKGCAALMTSGTNPYGTVTASGYSSAGHEGYVAFNNSEDSYWRSDSVTHPWIQYEFTLPILVKRIKYMNASSVFSTGTFILQGSNDGVNYTDLITFTNS